MASPAILIMTERAALEEGISVALTFAGATAVFARGLPEAVARQQEYEAVALIVDQVAEGGGVAPYCEQLDRLIEQAATLPTFFLGTGNEPVADAMTADAIGAAGFFILPCLAKDVTQAVEQAAGVSLSPVPESIQLVEDAAAGMLSVESERTGTSDVLVQPPSAEEVASLSGEGEPWTEDPPSTEAAPAPAQSAWADDDSDEEETTAFADKKAPAPEPDAVGPDRMRKIERLRALRRVKDDFDDTTDVNMTQVAPRPAPVEATLEGGPVFEEGQGPQLVEDALFDDAPIEDEGESTAVGIQALVADEERSQEADDEAVQAFVEEAHRGGLAPLPETSPGGETTSSSEEDEEALSSPPLDDAPLDERDRVTASYPDFRPPPAVLDAIADVDDDSAEEGPEGASVEAGFDDDDIPSSPVPDLDDDAFVAEASADDESTEQFPSEEASVAEGAPVDDIVDAAADDDDEAEAEAEEVLAADPVPAAVAQSVPVDDIVDADDDDSVEEQDDSGVFSSGPSAPVPAKAAAPVPDSDEEPLDHLLDSAVAEIQEAVRSRVATQRLQVATDESQAPISDEDAPQVTAEAKTDSIPIRALRSEEARARVEEEVERALRVQAEKWEAERIEREAALWERAREQMREEFDLELRREVGKTKVEAEARLQERLAAAVKEERASSERSRQELESRLARDAEERLRRELEALERNLRDELEADFDTRRQALQDQFVQERSRVSEGVRAEAEEEARGLLESKLSEERARGRAEVETRVQQAMHEFEERAERDRLALEAALRGEFDERLARDVADVKAASDADAQARLEQERTAHERERADALLALEQRLTDEAEQRTQRALHELQARLADEHQTRMGQAVEQALEHEREQEVKARAALAEQVQREAEARVSAAYEERLANTRAELMQAAQDRLAEQESALLKERAALLDRVRLDEQTAAKERLERSMDLVREQMSLRAEEQLGLELARQQERLTVETETLVERARREAEERERAAYEERLQSLEVEARQRAEAEVRRELEGKVKEVEEREALARARLSFRMGQFGAVVPAGADIPDGEAIGQQPWKDSEAAKLIGQFAFDPSGSTALVPPDPDRVLPLEPAAGHFRDGEIVALLWSAHFLAVTGRITIRHEDGRSRELYLEQGEPVAFASALAADRPENALLRGGLIAARVHAELKSGPLESARRLCARLVEDGTLKTQELFTAVRGILTEQVLSLLEWDAGTFHYEPERAHAADRVRLEHGFDAVLADGVRRKFDEERLWRVLGGPATIVGPDQRALRLPPLGPRELETVAFFDGTRPLEDIILAVGAPVPVVLRAALILLSAGALYVKARGLAKDPMDRAVQHDRDVSIDKARIGEKRRLAREGDYFEFLGIPAEATTFEVRRAAEQILARFDPGHFADPAFVEVKKDLVEICEVAREAEHVLTSPGLRAGYERRQRKKALQVVPKVS